MSSKLEKDFQQGFVQLLNGTTSVITIAKDALLIDLQESIQASTNIAPSQQRLTFCGKPLDDGARSLASYMIGSLSTIQLQERFAALPMGEWGHYREPLDDEAWSLATYNNGFLSTFQLQVLEADRQGNITGGFEHLWEALRSITDPGIVHDQTFLNCPTLGENMLENNGHSFNDLSLNLGSSFLKNNTSVVADSLGYF